MSLGRDPQFGDEHGVWGIVIEPDLIEQTASVTEFCTAPRENGDEFVTFAGQGTERTDVRVGHGLIVNENRLIGHNIVRMGLMRVTWGMNAAVWFVMIVLACIWWGTPAIIIAVVFGLMPDIALIGAFAEKGRLKPSRVPLYNTLHMMWAPIGIFIIGVAVLFFTGGFEAGIWQIALAGLAWFVHVAADRAFGFGLRDDDGTILPIG